MLKQNNFYANKQHLICVEAVLFKWHYGPHDDVLSMFSVDGIGIVREALSSNQTDVIIYSYLVIVSTIVICYDIRSLVSCLSNMKGIRCNISSGKFHVIQFLSFC